MLGDTEQPLKLKERWLRQGVANSDKFLFTCHDTGHRHVPFSQPLPCEKEGYLTKKGEVGGLWQRRFMRLTGTSLAYFKQPSDTTPRGTIELQGSEVFTADEKTGKKFSFEVKTPDRDFLIHADNRSELEEWFEVLKSKVARISLYAIYHLLDSMN